MNANLPKTAEEMKDDIREMCEIPNVLSRNPFGPDTETAGDSNNNQYSYVTRYLKGHAGGTFKAAQYLVAYDSPEMAVSNMVFDTLEQLEVEESEHALKDPEGVANFLVSTYVEKHGWKAGIVEDTAAETYARSIGGRVVEQKLENVAQNEKDSIDQIVEKDGEKITIQVKTNTNNNVKPKNRDKVDILLRVDAEIDQTEIDVTVEQVE